MGSVVGSPAAVPKLKLHWECCFVTACCSCGGRCRDHISEVIGFLWYDNAWRYVSTISAEHLYHLLCLWCLVWCDSRYLVGHGCHGVLFAHLATSLGRASAKYLNRSPRFNKLSLYFLCMQGYTVNENAAHDLFDWKKIYRYTHEVVSLF